MMNSRYCPLFFLACVLHAAPTPGVESLTQTPAAREPVVYTGKIQPEKTRIDGRLPHVVGVHHYQAFRANRTQPSEPGVVGWTYNHQPYLAFWNGRFYLQYLSGLVQEHEPPTRTLLMTSADGRTWSSPAVAFPEYQLPEINRDGIHIAKGMFAVMHQRMGFYVAPNGRLLTLGFYGYCENLRHSPNSGNGLGRVVREVRADGTLGPIYFIRFNQHAGFDASNTAYPFYRDSKDAGFLAACEALLADKLMTLQWWEEDRGEDGFYAINPGKVADAAAFSAKVVTHAGAGKAFSWFTRPDGVVVGLWKNQYAALSPDRGRTWTPIVKNPTLWTTGSKIWGQRTSDGRYALVHNQSATMSNRFPMVVFTGDDGHAFDTLLCLQPEVAPRRFQGSYKTPGTAYFRGAEEGNGSPPDKHLWITYSMNKEDIWISRTTVPIRAREEKALKEDFENAADVADLERWNLHIPQWAPTRPVAEEGLASGAKNRVLELQDEEPYDYASATRVFPESRRVTIAFRLQARAVPRGNALYVEVQSQRGGRPMQVRLDGEWLGFDHGTATAELVKAPLRRWHSVEMDFDCEKQAYGVRVNGTVTHAAIPFFEKVESVARVVFRTGPFRGWVSPPYVEKGGYKPGGMDTDDLPGADTRAARAIYWVDDIETRM
jgi:hypothetical protein